MTTSLFHGIRARGRSASATLLALALHACGGGESGTEPTTAPNPPSGFTAVVNSTTQVTLSWVLPAGTVTEVKIERSVAGAAFAPLTTIKPATNSYVDSGLQPNTAYQYKVQACNGSACSTFSETSVNTSGTGATALTISNPALPPSLVSYPYTPELRTTGGTGTTRTWSLVSGTLPTGVTLSADGTFRGTPTATGSFPITVRVAGGGATAQKDFTIRIIEQDLTRWNITRMDTQPVAANLEPAVQAALRRWESIIVGDLHVDTIPNGFYRTGFNCGGFGPATEGTFIDDFFLIVNIVALPGTVLGQANTCGYRWDDETSVIGVLTLNSTQLQMMAGSTQLENVIFHEIGHTLGFGTMWDVGQFGGKRNLISQGACVWDVQTGNRTVGDNPQFTGPQATKAWTDGGKTGNPTIENEFGPGTVCAHWRKSVFKTEVMTGFIEPAGVTQQVSAVTIASMADLGFTVDMSKADPFVPPGAPATLRGPSPWTTELSWPGPWEIVQPEGPPPALGGRHKPDRR